MRLLGLALPLYLIGCCNFRERHIRAALAPYVDAMKERSSCPENLDELGVPRPAGIRETRNGFEGYGAVVSYHGGSCTISYVVGFCGRCRSLGKLDGRDSSPWSCAY